LNCTDRDNVSIVRLSEEPRQNLFDHYNIRLKLKIDDERKVTQEIVSDNKNISQNSRKDDRRKATKHILPNFFKSTKKL